MAENPLIFAPPFKAAKYKASSNARFLEVWTIIKLSNQTILLLCDFWSTTLSQIELDYKITWGYFVIYQL